MNGIVSDVVVLCGWNVLIMFEMYSLIYWRCVVLSRSALFEALKLYSFASLGLVEAKSELHQDRCTYTPLTWYMRFRGRQKMSLYLSLAPLFVVKYLRFSPTASL